jgi:hypothetical protein
MPFTSSQASGAAHESWAKTLNRTQRTHAAREAALAALEREVDPDNIMSPADRRKAAHNRRTARLLLGAEKARKAKRAKRNGH